VSTVDDIKRLLRECSPEERYEIFQLLRQEFPIHPLERLWNTKAELILEAINRSSDLSKRGLRGLIAEAAFVTEIIGKLSRWKDITPPLNLPYDYMLEDEIGKVRVQIKLQRQEKHIPKLAKSVRDFRACPDGFFIVETQKTRAGKNTAGEDTRPYRYGEFDILGVCLHPSTNEWNEFVFTVAEWLIPDPKNSRNILKLQPVSPIENEDWTRDFDTSVEWFRSGRKKTICEGLVK
jgi:hypothetical protein